MIPETISEGEDRDWAAIQEARRFAENRTERERRLMRNRGKKILLGYEGPEKHEGWSGSLPFYLFWCENCGHWCKDYPHGYEERQYLRCHFCDAYYDFVHWKTKLRMAWETIRFSFAMRPRR